MQLGIGSYTYGWSVGQKNNGALPAMNEYYLVDKANEFGIKLLQIGDNLPMHEWDEQRLISFKKVLIQNGIQLQIGARGLTDEHLNSYIHLCKRFEARLLRFVIDEREYEPPCYEVIEILKKHVALLEENNITLALENHDRLKAKEFAQIIEGINSKQVGICLDTGNSMGAGEGVEIIIETLAPYTVNLHLKDFGIARLTHKQGFIIDGRITGEGMLNVPEILKSLKPYKLCHTCILEQWVPPEKERQATVEKEHQWAKKGIKYLKSLSFWN